MNNVLEGGQGARHLLIEKMEFAVFCEKSSSWRWKKSYYITLIQPMRPKCFLISEREWACLDTILGIVHFHLLSGFSLSIFHHHIHFLPSWFSIAYSFLLLFFFSFSVFVVWASSCCSSWSICASFKCSLVVWGDMFKVWQLASCAAGLVFVSWCNNMAYLVICSFLSLFAVLLCLWAVLAAVHSSFCLSANFSLNILASTRKALPG